MAEEDTSEDTSKDTEDNPEDTPDDAPTDAAEAAPEDAVEAAPEEASVDAHVDTLDPVEDPEEGDASTVSEPAPAAVASGTPGRLGRPGRTAAIAVGATLAIAAVAVGAAWAIVAIAADDDRSARHEQRLDAGKAAGGDDDRREQFGDQLDRDRQERWERAQRERNERLERLEELKREREERSGRIEELKREWQERRLDDAPRDGSARPGRPSTEECRTVLSLGEGDDALTVLVCNLPQAEPWQFEPGSEDEFEPGDGFEFRRAPRDLAPLFEMFEDFRGFDGWPFGRGQWPFGTDGDRGFPDGGRGFWFGGQDGDRGNGIERFCFGEDGVMSCFGDGEGLEDLDQLSEEQLREIEEWMESFRWFGPSRFLEDFPLEDFRLGLVSDGANV